MFVDEIHRFNKSQQDAFYHMGKRVNCVDCATTENPSFALNNALLSRLKGLYSEKHWICWFREIIAERFRNPLIYPHTTQQNMLIQAADGDARRLLTLLEILSDYSDNGNVVDEDVSLIISGQNRRFDNKGYVEHEQYLHYTNVRAAQIRMPHCIGLTGMLMPVVISIYRQKAVTHGEWRYWQCRSQSLNSCFDAWESWRRLGSPEGDLALSTSSGLSGDELS